MAAVLLSNPGLPLAVLGNPGKRKYRVGGGTKLFTLSAATAKAKEIHKKTGAFVSVEQAGRRRNPGPQTGSSDTGASSSGDSPNRNTTQTGGSSPGGASTGGVASGLGGAGTGGAATGGASTGGAGTVTLTISGSSSTATNTGSSRGRGRNGKSGSKEKERPIHINISNVGGRTDAGNVASGDGPGASGSGGKSKGKSSGGGGGGAAPDEPEHYSTGKDAKRLNHSTRTNPMSKRTPRFFLRRFKRGKRNPPFTASGYTPGGAFVGTVTTATSQHALRKRLAAKGIEISSIKRISSKKRKHMAKTRRRHSAKRRIRRIKHHSRAVGRIFRRTKGKRRFALKILGVRKGNGRKRKVNAVRWSGKKGSRIYRALSYGSRHKKGTHIMGFTNPKRRSKRRSRHSRARRNPGVASDFLRGLTSAPGKVAGLFKGPNMIKNVGFTAGGAIGTFMIGGVLASKVIKPLLEKVAPSFAAQVADPSTIAARVVGGIMPYGTAFLITKLFGKKLGPDVCNALMLGGAIASAIEVIRPGMVGDALKKLGLGELPYAGPALAGLGALNGPVCGLGYSAELAGYVQSPSYSGTAGYVDAPSYSGSAGINGYVSAASYSGTAGMGQEQLAGTFLDDAADNILNNDWLNTETDASDAAAQAAASSLPAGPAAQ